MAQTHPDRHLRILSLDGGGIRGYSSLLILQHLFFRLNRQRQRKQPGAPELHPWDYFDLIGGTSTGAIIAILLGRLKIPINECIKIYKKIGTEIFGSPNRWHIRNRYDAVALEKLITEEIKDRFPGQKADKMPLIDPQPANCKTIVFYLSKHNLSASVPYAARTYESDEEINRVTTVLEAIRAPSAALAYFAPAELGSIDDDDIKGEGLDAGLGFNNPSEEVREEARKLFGTNRKLDDAAVSIFISIGTGIPSPPRYNSKKWFHRITKFFGKPYEAIKILEKAATNTEKVHKAMERHYPRYTGRSSQYQRWNVPAILGDMNLGDYKKMDEIKDLTDSYLRESREQDVVLAVDQMESAWAVSQEVPLDQLSDSALEDRLNALSQQSPSSHTLRTLVSHLQNENSLLTRGLYYWSHLTPAGHRKYAKIYALLCAEVEELGSSEEVDIVRFFTHFGMDAPSPDIVLKMWQRFGIDVRTPLRKSRVFALMYMIHLEIYSSKFPHIQPGLTAAGHLGTRRMKITSAFAEWIPCVEPKNCPLEWNFAGEDWGFSRGTKLRTCPVYKRYREREAQKMNKPGDDSWTDSLEKQPERQKYYKKCYELWLAKGEEKNS